MPHFTQKDADCRVYTFKDGLLSAIAHDLEIRLERFQIEWDDARTKIEARFELPSLRVAHAMKDGAPNASALSDRDKRKIESNMHEEVLEARRHPEAKFVSTEIEQRDGRTMVRGTLELHGRTSRVEAEVRREGERWVGEATLHQPDFGITPYSAMMGTLRIKPDVRVKISAPA